MLVGRPARSTSIQSRTVPWNLALRASSENSGSILYEQPGWSYAADVARSGEACAATVRSDASAAADADATTPARTERIATQLAPRIADAWRRGQCGSFQFEAGHQRQFGVGLRMGQHKGAITARRRRATASGGVADIRAAGGRGARRGFEIQRSGPFRNALGQVGARRGFRAGTAGR